MAEAWLNFAAVFFVQAVLFIFHAWYEKKLSVVPQVLWRGVLCGIVLGPPTDLFFGKFLGLCSYALGFGAFFLVLNGALLYGIFAANVLLMQQARLLHFCIWIVVAAAAFEVTNLYFRLWTYTFPVPSIEYFIAAFVGPLVVAMLIAYIWHDVLGERFIFIDTLRKK